MRTTGNTVFNESGSNQYYIEQCMLYQECLVAPMESSSDEDSSIPQRTCPNLADNVLRWEWSHLGRSGRLTGRGRNGMTALDIFQQAAAPQTIRHPKFFPLRQDHQNDQTQTPGTTTNTATVFCSHVQFKCSEGGGKYEKYQEFTFNNKTEILFIEEWTSQRGSKLTEDQKSGKGRISTNVMEAMMKKDNEEGNDTNPFSLVDALSQLQQKDHQTGTALEQLVMDLETPLEEWFSKCLKSYLEEQILHLHQHGYYHYLFAATTTSDQHRANATKKFAERIQAAQTDIERVGAERRLDIQFPKHKTLLHVDGGGNGTRSLAPSGDDLSLDHVVEHVLSAVQKVLEPEDNDNTQPATFLEEMFVFLFLMGLWHQFGLWLEHSIRWLLSFNTAANMRMGGPFSLWGMDTQLRLWYLQRTLSSEHR